MWRRGEELERGLAKMFLTALRDLADLALMSWVVLKSWATGSSGYRHSTGASPT
jgi:hypothetical protein